MALYVTELRFVLTVKAYLSIKRVKLSDQKKIAAGWIAKREAEIENNPEILFGQEKLVDLTLTDAIDRYLAEVGSEYGRTKTYALKLIQKFPIAQHIITKIKVNSHRRTCCAKEDWSG